MNCRERFLRLMNYQPVDRCLYGMPWGGLWDGTAARWKGEGFDPSEFRTDEWIWEMDWFNPQPPFKRRVISEDPSTVTVVNEMGIVVRERKENPGSSMPQFLRFPVETREDFRSLYAKRMRADLASRIGKDWIQILDSRRDRDRPFAVIANLWGGFFGPLRNFVGLERLCTLLYDDLPFVEEMMDATAEFLVAVMGQILEHTTVDVFGFWEDMAYRNGPLIGPNWVSRFMVPRYRKVVDFVRSRGVEWIALDCDGRVDPLISVWLDAGINFLYPFEVQSGMDVVAVRRKFGRDLRMFGGVDKRALARGRDAIDGELCRVSPLVREGGYIPCLDHSVPPDVPYANYRYYMQRLRQIL